MCWCEEPLACWRMPGALGLVRALPLSSFPGSTKRACAVPAVATSDSFWFHQPGYDGTAPGI